MYGLTDYGWMLRDPRRIDAYSRALAAVISPQSIVVDLGAGIGTFSILACNLGAAKVYAIEPSDIVSVAEEIARRNGVADRIQFIQARAADADVPEKIDVIVSDLCGALPLFEEHIPAVMHVRDSFLKTGGALIPARDRLLCAPVSSAELYARVTSPWRSLPNVDLSPAETMALHTPHATVIEPHHLCAAPRIWATLDYATIASPDVRATIEWDMPEPRVVHGFALWFESTLHGDITLSSGPWSPQSIHSTMFLPLLETRETAGTLQLMLDARLIGGRYVVTWRADSGALQSTFFCRPTGAAGLGPPGERSGASPIPNGGTWTASHDVLARDIEDGLLLLDLDTGHQHRLNRTAAEIWRLLTNAVSSETIANRLTDAYDVDAASAARDVDSILGELRDEGLVVWNEG